MQQRGKHNPKYVDNNPHKHKSFYTFVTDKCVIIHIMSLISSEEEVKKKE